MVDTKKEQEREELHRAIWSIADDLRGAVDGWDFKSYVLGTMFYRYISENINKIVDTFAQRAEEAHFSHLAEYSEVQENDYNLSVSTYVEAKDTREKIDIVKLNAEIAQIVARENELRAAIDQIVAEIEG